MRRSGIVDLGQPNWFYNGARRPARLRAASAIRGQQAASDRSAPHHRRRRRSGGGDRLADRHPASRSRRRVRRRIRRARHQTCAAPARHGHRRRHRLARQARRRGAQGAAAGGARLFRQRRQRAGHHLQRAQGARLGGEQERPHRQYEFRRPRRQHDARHAGESLRARHGADRRRRQCRPALAAALSGGLSACHRRDRGRRRRQALAGGQPRARR